jgi:hypothetical protein
MSISQSARFDYGARSAELFTLHFSGCHRLDYRRFESALDAICFAIEELDEKLLHGAVLEVDETRYKSAEIKSLYKAIPSPWSRKPAASGPKTASKMERWYELDRTANRRAYLPRGPARGICLAALRLVTRWRTRMITVHHFTVWDPVGERTITLPLKSPTERIRRIGGTIVPDTAENINESELDLHGRYNPRRG